jgi:endogenous inhibitor of DNA gyrase (YacG/DUF329 family)
MEQTIRQHDCPECGKTVNEKSYMLECEYCLSKKED